jgi:hypothetical protein
MSDSELRVTLSLLLDASGQPQAHLERALPIFQGSMDRDFVAQPRERNITFTKPGARLWTFVIDAAFANGELTFAKRFASNFFRDDVPFRQEWSGGYNLFLRPELFNRALKATEKDHSNLEGDIEATIIAEWESHFRGLRYVDSQARLDRSHRIDIRAEDISSGGVVIIELKTTAALPKHLRQIECYLNHPTTNAWAAGRGVRGLLVAPTFMPKMGESGQVTFHRLMVNPVSIERWGAHLR